MSKQLFEMYAKDTESEVFKQLVQDEEFSNLILKFKEDERHMVVKTIKGMVTNIEKTLKKEVSIK